MFEKNHIAEILTRHFSTQSQTHFPISASYRIIVNLEFFCIEYTLVYFQILESQGHIDFPTNWPQALGYAPWVEEVWANYLSNAIKYGGEQPRIEVGATPLNRMVRFWVKDEGPGISPDDQTRLFTPFTLLKSIKGHGLGLSIVERIIQKCGGEVGVESQLDQGSTFWFTLPAA